MVKVEGKKFSKSRGYVVWVEEDYLKADLNPDYLRYYIVNYTSHQRDLNFSWHVFRDKVNNELIATLGNFIYRVMHFAWKNFGKVKMDVDEEVTERIRRAKETIEDAISRWEFKEASDAFMELAGYGNSFFQSSKPWEVIKEDRNEAERVIASALAIVRALAVLAYPVLPRSMRAVAETVGLDIDSSTLDTALDIPEYVKVGKPEVPFERIDDEKMEELERIMMERIRDSGEEGEKMDERIGIEEFQRLDIRIGKVLKAEKVKGSKKLMRLEVDIGNEVRQIVAGIAEEYSPEELEGEPVAVLVNIKPARLMGVESNGMILAADINGKPVLLKPEKDVEPGARVR